jgi:pyrimidine-specific ribonucleoside hydrolase
MKRFYLISAVFFICLSLYSHPWKPSNYVIIDTDGGVDDLKAITMLLASPDVRVLGITASTGILSAENAYIKVRSLLISYHHEGVPAAINRSGTGLTSDFPAAAGTSWGKDEGINASNAPDYISLIRDLVLAERTKIRFICLGSMSTAYNALREIPEFKTSVKDFVWSADGPDDKNGFNYLIDRNSSVAMLKQETPVKIVRKFSLNNGVLYNEEFIESIRNISTIYARKISSLFDTPEIQNHKFSFEAVDEMSSVFIHYPELFINKTSGNISDCIPTDISGLKEGIVCILKGETTVKNQVIREFPADPSFYFEDLSGSVTRIIDRYGKEEWNSGILANELHRHLGVFAITGVKMGIRAREYFNTGVDEFSVRSFAGSVPPLSCFNDGLQVSTGATPGHGLLKVINDPPLSPSAEFTYLNRKIRLTLKPEITEKITSELKEIDFVYGLDSNTYWELVRANSIKYWLELDRHEIFDIQVLK